MSNFLFADFTPVNESNWLARIEKDLKGRALTDLQWHLNENLILNPFAHADSLPDTHAPLTTAAANTWEIGEDINVLFDTEGLKQANRLTLNALMGGANAPRFNVPTYPTAEQLATLLEGVELAYISVHFAPENRAENPHQFLQRLADFATMQGLAAADLRGSVAFNPLQQDVEKVKEVVRWAAVHLPQLKVIVINGITFFDGSKEVVKELNHTLQLVNQVFEYLTEGGLSADEVAKTTTVALQVGVSYFIEIAKFRAFKLLWGNLLAAYGVLPTFPNLDVVVSTATQGEDEHTNKIKATTQAMSAVIAGVQRLTLMPSDMVKNAQSSDFSRRVARNVQHLLQMESYFDKVADPSAGSYYIETLTNTFAEKAWLS